MPQAFRSSTTTPGATYGTVLAVVGTQVRVRVGPSSFMCRVAAPLSLCDIRVGDTVFLIHVQDKTFAIAISRPETAVVERVVTNVISNSVGVVPPPPPPAPGPAPFDDAHLLRRDGVRSLLAAAYWVWEAGAEVAGVFRSWGTGLLQVIGGLYAGRREGAHVGIFEHQTEDDAIWSSLMQGVDSANVPFISFGVRHDDDPNSAWVNIGRAGSPSIHFGPLAGQAFDVPLVDAALLHGQIPGSQIDTMTLKIPVVESLEGLNFEEPTLFELRLGTDSGALYMWTRWGPSPIGGYHRAGPHTHGNFDEGDQLNLAVACSDVAIVAPAADDILRYNAATARWQNVTATAFLADYTLADLSQGGNDAASLTYTPMVAANWDGGVDPGNVAPALNQLADRTQDVEYALTAMDVYGATVGFLPYAYLQGYGPANSTGTDIDIAATGGVTAGLVVLGAAMMLDSVSVYLKDTSLQRSWNWALYVQRTNAGNASENTLERVAYGNAAETYTASAAGSHTIAANSGPVILAPGAYWLLIQNVHATNALKVGCAVGTTGSYATQRKVCTNPVGATLDFVAATWTRTTYLHSGRLNGRVFGESTIF